MRFHELKNTIVDLLGDNADSKFVTIGYKKNSISDIETKDDYRSVQVFSTKGEFPKNKHSGPYQHDVNFTIRITASKPCLMDIAVIEDPMSTTEQKIAAISASQNSTDLAENSAYECLGYVFLILSDARYSDFGLAGNVVSNKKIESWDAKEPVKFGKLTIKEIDLFISVSVDEDLQGETPVESEEPIIKTMVDVYGEEDDENQDCEYEVLE